MNNIQSNLFTKSIEPDLQFERELAAMIVAAINLNLNPNEIKPEDALYGEGLGLDSIDILEIALVISKNFGIQMKADSKDNLYVFSSLRALANYIKANRTK